MTVISKTVKLKWNGRSKKYYEEKGYKYTGLKKEFEVKIEDLSEGSHVKIEILCDFCKINKFFRSYKDHLVIRNKSKNKNDNCKECIGNKRNEVNLVTYKTEYELVKFNFESKGLNLITPENEFINSKSILKFTCSKHLDKDVMETKWSYFKKYTHGCKYCGQEATVQYNINNYNKVYGDRNIPWELNINTAQEEFDKKGLILISDIYNGINFPMKFICKIHKEEGEQESTLKIIKNGKFGCKWCRIESQSGENSHLWKGGITEKNLLERSSYKFDIWRKEVFVRDNYICQACGDSTGHNLTAHHIENFSNNESKRFDVNNGITLCEDCHLPQRIGSFHYIFGTSNNSKEQLDEFLIYKRTHINFDPNIIEIRRGERKRNKNAKLTDEQVLEIRKRLENGDTCVSISNDYKVRAGLIQKIKAGNSYKSVYGGKPIINKRRGV